MPDCSLWFAFLKLKIKQLIVHFTIFMTSFTADSVIFFDATGIIRVFHAENLFIAATLEGHTQALVFCALFVKT